MSAWMRPRKGVTMAFTSDWYGVRAPDDSILDQLIMILPDSGASVGLQGNSSRTDCGRWSEVFRSSSSRVPQLSSTDAAPISSMNQKCMGNN